ncbi:MAG: transketolase [Thermomicrobiales bacterium]|nr:transketolase [Thermomicrobiales bacterium]
MAVATTRDQRLETLAINTIRMLSVDAVQQANSGHPGLPMGAASMAYVLWTEFLKHNPKDPHWPDRDRFVLSAGHGSMLLYSLLHLTGYDLPLEQIRQFRQLGSMTPGHPERGDAPGVEVTTGPLGQGFANGVGMAIAEAFLAARYNRPGHEIVDHFTYGIVSDGDVMEGVAMEAAAIAGHLRLGKLIYLYDQNQITLAGTANLSMSEDVGARFEAMGWQTFAIDGMDTDAVREALDDARSDLSRPSLILARTQIGYGSPKKQNTFGVHGSPLGPDEVRATKENLGWPLEPAFYLPDEALSHFREALDRGAEFEAAWRMRFESYAEAYPELAAEFMRAQAGELPEGWDADLPSWKPGDKPIATRKASEAAIQAFFPKIPTFIGGSADLNPSTNTGMKGAGDFESPSLAPDGSVQGALGGGWSYAGRNIHFGVREHGMGSSVNGMAAHGGVIPFGATFLVFSDYMRPAVRLSALSHLKSIWVWTHDSIAVGEDGPTHEPVEHVMSLRLIPNLTVIRPADANETVEAWRVALTTKNRPTALILTRQDLEILDRSGARGDVGKGGYVLIDADGDPDIVLIGTGSEVALCVKTREALAEHGIKARVVSLPSWELFDAQGATYTSQVLGPEGTPRLSVEAGVTTGWQRHLGANGRTVGIDRYGASGPGSKILAHFGFTKEHVTAEALRLLGRDDLANEIEPEPEGGETAGEEAKGGEGHS